MNSFRYDATLLCIKSVTWLIPVGMGGKAENSTEFLKPGSL